MPKSEIGESTSAVAITTENVCGRICNVDTERVDLHIHSSFSDGTYSPSELIKMASEAGLRAVALTDHNTVGGLDEFLKAAEDYDVDAVPGIEFSTEQEGKELHIVGLFVDKSAWGKVEKFLDAAKKAKEESNRALLRNLKKAGYDVSYEELSAKASGSINRAVIGKYLAEKGIISSVKEGFAMILSESGGYYTPPKRLSSLDTIKFIRFIGAVSVLAHPLLNLSPQELERFLKIAKAAGLDAMETRYSLFTVEQTKYLESLAKRYELLPSGGSDYHGECKPDISLGSGRGDLFVPLSYYLNLLKNKKRRF